jgi:hypothetical protein
MSLGIRLDTQEGSTVLVDSATRFVALDEAHAELLLGLTKPDRQASTQVGQHGGLTKPDRQALTK